MVSLLFFSMIVWKTGKVKHLPFDTNNIIGFNVADATSNMAIVTYIREYFARIKVFIDIITEKKPMSCEIDKVNRTIP